MSFFWLLSCLVLGQAPGLSPKELLESAIEKTKNIKQSVLINQYKKAIIDAKAPNSNALAAYHQLPEEAQKAIDQSQADSLRKLNLIFLLSSMRGKEIRLI